MIWLALVLVALAGYRAALALTMDKLSAGMRAHIVKRYPARHRPGDPAGTPPRPRMIVELVHCPRCMSVWTTGAATALAWVVLHPGPWPAMLIVWPAAAGIDVPLIRWAP